MENKNYTIIWFLVIALVIAGLIFITVYKKDNADVSDTLAINQEENTNMQNTQQIEGVKVTILREGNGEIAKAGDTVAMNYTGKLTDGTTFDSNMDPKFQHVEPFVFTIGAGMVIKGWDLGIAGMKIGEKRNLTIEPSYAYGSSGAGGVIPPNATLFFDVELLAIK